MVCSILAAQQAPPPTAPPKIQNQAPAAQPPIQIQGPVVQAPEDVDRMLSISAYDWLPSGGPRFRGGIQAPPSPPHDLRLPQKPSKAYGAMLTVPMKGSTRLELSYEALYDRAGVFAPTDVGLFGATIAKGEPLDMFYDLTHAKVSWNYLSYPNPPQDAKFRFKTLWEFHYMKMKPTVVLAATAPDLPVTESLSIYLPAVGAGIEYVPSRHFRMELRGSGMGWPKRSAVGDGEATAVVRVRRLEIFAGGKALYFRTSPKKETFVESFLWGPYGGVRWVFK